MPRIIHKARKIMDDPDSSMKDLADRIELVPAITVRILKVANSAFYCRREKVASIHDSVTILGVVTLSELLILACSSKLMGSALKGYGFSRESFWKHCLAVAFGSKAVADRKNLKSAGDAFTAGLIHDVGKLILDRYILERKDAFDIFMSDGNKTHSDAEKEILGVDHAEIATDVCEKWKIPRSVSAAIKRHHNPSGILGNELAYILNVSDHMANWSGFNVDGISLEIGDTYEKKLDLSIDDVESTMDEMVDYVNKISSDTL